MHIMGQDKKMASTRSKLTEVSRYLKNSKLVQLQKKTSFNYKKHPAGRYTHNACSFFPLYKLRNPTP